MAENVYKDGDVRATITNTTMPLYKPLVGTVDVPAFDVAFTKFCVRKDNPAKTGFYYAGWGGRFLTHKKAMKFVKGKECVVEIEDLSKFDESKEED